MDYLDFVELPTLLFATFNSEALVADFCFCIRKVSICTLLYVLIKLKVKCSTMSDRITIAQ